MTDIFLYVDEAGDFACGKDASEFATLGIAYVIGRQPEREEIQIKRLLKTINTRIKPDKKVTEFKFSSNITKIKRRVLRGMLKLDINFGIMTISKDLVNPELQNSAKLLYRHSLVESIVPLIEKYLSKRDTNNRLYIIPKEFPCCRWQTMWQVRHIERWSIKILHITTCSHAG